MTINTHHHLKHTLAILAAGAFGLGLATTPLHAQSYEQPTYFSGSEEVIVQAPRHTERSWEGFPIEDVAISRAVPYDDLDLTTDSGARALEARVMSAAYIACDEMDTLHPIATSDSPPCLSRAIDEGMRDAHRAIDRTRGW